MLHNQGISTSIGIPAFEAGDVIGCTIDQDMGGRVAFYLNGKQVIPLEDIATVNPPRGHVSQHRGLDIQDPNYEWIPVACFYAAQKGSCLSVRFNFKGNFSYPIPDFGPYGGEVILPSRLHESFLA